MCVVDFMCVVLRDCGFVCVRDFVLLHTWMCALLRECLPVVVRVLAV